MYRQAPPVDWFWGRFGDQKKHIYACNQARNERQHPEKDLEDIGLCFNTKKIKNVKSAFGNLMGSSTLFVCILATLTFLHSYNWIKVSWQHWGVSHIYPEKPAHYILSAYSIISLWMKWKFRHLVRNSYRFLSFIFLFFFFVSQAPKVVLFFSSHHMFPCLKEVVLGGSSCIWKSPFSVICVSFRYFTLSWLCVN